MALSKPMVNPVLSRFIGSKARHPILLLPAACSNNAFPNQVMQMHDAVVMAFFIYYEQL